MIELAILNLASIVSPGTYLRNDQGTFLVLEAMAIRYRNNGGHAGQFLWRRAMQKGIYAQRKVPDQLPPERRPSVGANGSGIIEGLPVSHHVRGWPVSLFSLTMDLPPTLRIVLGQVPIRWVYLVLGYRFCPFGSSVLPVATPSKIPSPSGSRKIWW